MEEKIIVKDKDLDMEENVYTQEEVFELLQDLLPEVKIDTEELNDVKIDADKFKNGVDSVAEICGKYVALTSVGMDSNSAVDVIMNLLNIEYNKEVNKQTCENNLQVAEIQGTIQTNNEL